MPLAFVMVLGLGGIHPLANTFADEIAAGFSMTYKLLADPTVPSPHNLGSWDNG